MDGQQSTEGLTPKARESVTLLRGLAIHLEHVAELCEAGNADAWLACGQLEKEFVKLRNKLMKAVPPKVKIDINIVEPKGVSMSI